MNLETDPKPSFLSWQGQVTGPHTLREIQTLLKLGKIHSLYKIQSDGEWILLRDHLTELDQKSRVEDRRLMERQAAQDSRTFETGAVKAAILVPDEDPAGFMEAPVASNPPLEDEENGEVESKGIAITSFVLSLFFFVPFLNGITWLLSLIFGHLAYPETERARQGKYATLVWVGLWLSYVEISFFMLGLAWLSVMEFPNMSLGYYMIHGQMLGTVLGALIGGGVLMLAIKLTSGQLVDFSTCFVGALLPSVLGALGMLMIQTSVHPADLTKAKGLVLIGVVNFVLFIAQIFFWARHIQLPNDEELGLNRATLASMIYTVIFVFVGIGYLALFAAISN